MPFLKNSPEDDDSYQHPLNSSSIINYTLPLATNESTTAADGDVWTVKTLIPLTGSASICIAALFVFYFIRDCGKKKVTGGGSSPIAEEKGEAGAGDCGDFTSVAHVLSVCGAGGGLRNLSHCLLRQKQAG
jgi:hypothetical protein